MISESLKKRIVTSVVLLALFFLVINFNFLLIYTLILVGVLSLLEFFNIAKKIFKNKFFLIIFNFFFIIYIFSFCLMFFFFASLLHLKIILISLLLGCIASDIGGYVFGKLFKGPKLTKISPGKTVAGSLGSIILTCLTLLIIVFYFTNNFSLLTIFIAVGTSIACQVGDLFFSYLKRKAKIKDTGNILPGHGGILDRFDGILLGLPFGFILIALYLS